MDSIQGSPAWFSARLGCATGSRFKDILKGGKNKTRTTYLNTIVAERLSKQAEDRVVTFHMQRGINEEPLAKMIYESQTGNFVDPAGFIMHPMLAWIGVSPDGLIGDDGGIEIKSALPHVHLATMDSETYPEEHVAQVQGCLWVTGRKWWDFVSFSPKMPRQLYIYRVQRDPVYIEKLAAAVNTFLDEARVLEEKFYDQH